ncbi:EAL domain-containing protein [Vibrio sp. SM6]|uniref:EAL domain-containing protein n=1 Tax=Vibrio agarilyticus TaxID=2726741 RepID=A0A7X8YGH1_9VIBR|nr:LapD/MoxY N-terminal periplasmic domain-containing protein [Vibrio agarilyticus]NLS12684.1 EAL domain-containing protein [Vibrio agarilyticus]
MTLYRKLFIGMVAVFILLSSSAFIIELLTKKAHLAQQQQVEITNTLNSIGLALAPYINNDDPIAAESVINAVFDGSHYSSVELRYLQSEHKLVRQYPVQPQKAPHWLTQLNLFEPITADQVITSGWQQLAVIQITSHPGIAYDQFWQTLQRMSLVFAVMFILGSSAIAYIVKRSLKPLHAITQKVNKISNHEFDKPLDSPNTADLIPVVNGINRMATQLESSFRAQVEEAQKFRNKAYLDPVSKLGNRALFMAQLDHWVADQTPGGIAILKLGFINELYHQKAYQVADEKVLKIADTIRSLTSASVDQIVLNPTTARIAKDEIGFIFPKINETDLKLIVKALLAKPLLSQLIANDQDQNHYLFGVAHSDGQQTRAEILSLVDGALAKAKSRPDKPYGFISTTQTQYLFGKKQWQTIVEQAIRSGDVVFRFQHAKTMQGNTFHREVYSKIQRSGAEYHASEYLFALEQLQATWEYDKHVINAMIEQLASESQPTPIAINLSLSTVLEPRFIQWIKEVLPAHAAIAGQLHFELPEISFIQHAAITTLLCEAIVGSGARYGIDQYGRNFKSLAYINEFKPFYVKLDFLYTHNLDDENQRYTLTALSRTAYNLDITTIAARVETQRQLDFLSENFIDIYQGFIIDSLNFEPQIA